MKTPSLTTVLFIFLLCPNIVSSQEEVPKEVLLTTLNDVAHMKWENDQVKQLMDYNQDFVDDIYQVLESDDEDKRKKEKLDVLSYQRQIDLHEFLSKHQTNRYLKYMEDEMKPLTRKNKLLKRISKPQKMKHK